ncbi:MAG: 5-deoxy-glucuronate isomerase [Propionibacteriaceae bacterium]|jgi:5-deoxy-glucuronate isomerase|nr:5-deoxy-glucuronate isomerase [Propionibacteriaceae bacterium]
MSNDKWYFPAGSTADGPWTTVIDHSTPGWQHTGLRVARLDGARVELPAEDVERIILPLKGSFHLGTSKTDATGQSSFDLVGRPSVWSGPTDLLYVGPQTSLTIRGTGEVAVCSAHATAKRPPRYYPASATAAETRGSGVMTREVRNFGTPAAVDAESIIACEVLTPAGNWSSYPAHKHDHELAGVEAELEEIYYFDMRVDPRLRPAPERSDPLGYQRVSQSDDRAIDVMAEVRPGDTVLVPFGWHGPSMAAPGYDLYYLNVMAGPGRDREWLITDHPDQTWLRATWPNAAADPRLPFN